MGTTGIDIECERIQCVFGLGGGELHVADERFPDSEGWDGPEGIACWYEGVPDYVSLSELGLDWDDELRTAILCGVYGLPNPPEGWEQVASFTSSGEAACWWCGEGPGTEGQRGECKLCEEEGLVYIGDGWCEVIFKRVTHSS